LEDNVYEGGFCQTIEAFLQHGELGGKKIMTVCLPDCFVEHGGREELFRIYGLDAESVAERMTEMISGNEAM
jgi:1-deoxy-D-xylulose-5-phosphate synthase